MEGTRHTHIGQECGAFRQNRLVGCRYVRMGSYHCRDTAVEIPAHRNLFGSRLAMHIDEYDLDVFGQLRQFLIGYAKRIIRRRHKNPALQVEDRRFFSGFHFQDSNTCAGIIPRIVRWPQQPWVFVQIRHNLFLVPYVIPRCEDIDTPIEKLVRDFWCYPKPRSGVLTIQNREVGLVLLPEGLEVQANNSAAGLSNRVADKKYFHENLRVPMDGLDASQGWPLRSSGLPLGPARGVWRSPI